MKHYHEEWIKEWCEENGWTDLSKEHYMYWAFPPGAVIPEPIPSKTLKSIKAKKGLSAEEKLWGITATIAMIIGAILSYFLMSPMPVILAFCFCAIAVTQLEIEDY